MLWSPDTIREPSMSEATRRQHTRVVDEPLRRVGRDSSIGRGTWSSALEVFQRRELLGRLVNREIRAKYKNGWRDIDYVVIGHVPPVILRDLPLVTAALENSEVMARFGSGETEVTVRRVLKNAPD